MSRGRILYLTDKFGVSQGYMPAFTRMVHKCGIPRESIAITNIYGLVDKPLKKYKANEKLWKFDNTKLDKIHAAFSQRVRAIKPTLIVVSCPAILGVLSGGDVRESTLDKMRGGLYSFEDIPVIVVLPITAINQRVDNRLVVNEDGEEDKQTPYRVPDGQQILLWDWQKVGRFYQGKQRVAPPFKYSVCRTLNDVFAARDYLAECILLAPDIETGNYPPGLTCAGYTGILPNGAIHSFVIPLHDTTNESGCYWSEEDHVLVWSVIEDINNLPNLKTMHNGSYDASYFIRDRAPLRNWLLDSMVLWWSLYMELPKKLGFVASVLCDNYTYWKDDIKGVEEEGAVANLEAYWRYNALDTYYTLLSTLYLVALLARNKAMQINYNDAMLRVFSGLAMSMRGVAVDRKRMAEHRTNLEAELEKRTNHFRWLIDEPDFNINSSPHKKSLLYDVFGLRERTDKGRFVDPNKSAAGGNTASAGKIPLKLAKSEHPLFKYILDELEAAMEPRTQLSNVFGYTQEDGKVKGGLFMPCGRLRTSFSAVGTETTRFSSKKSAFWDGGNLQNIRGAYRDFIVPAENCVFLDVDYSQSDDVFMAYESQDPDKIAVVESGLDGHAVNGELFFGKSYDSIIDGKRRHDPLIVHPIFGIRQLAKKIVHGTNFQMAAMTLYVTMGREAVIEAARLLGIPNPDSLNQDALVQVCGRLMGTYRKKYKRLTAKEYYREIAEELKTKRAITNCFGITRQFLGDPSDNGTQREATAFIGQSATGSNMNRVMYEVDHGFIPKRFRDGPNPDALCKPLKMTRESHGFSFHLQVHDNFVSQLDTTHGRWKEAAHNLLQVMNRPVIIHGRMVRVAAEAELGLRWGKNMTSWDGKDPYDLDRIHTSLVTAEGRKS